MRPSVLFGGASPERGASVRIKRLSKTLTANLAATETWGGIGLEKEVTNNFGIFAGGGYDLREKRFAPRVGVTIGL